MWETEILKKKGKGISFTPYLWFSTQIRTRGTLMLSIYLIKISEMIKNLPSLRRPLFTEITEENPFFSSSLLFVDDLICSRSSWSWTENLTTNFLPHKAPSSSFPKLVPSSLNLQHVKVFDPPSSNLFREFPSSLPSAPLFRDSLFLRFNSRKTPPLYPHLSQTLLPPNALLSLPLVLFCQIARTLEHFPFPTPIMDIDYLFFSERELPFSLCLALPLFCRWVRGALKRNSCQNVTV